MPKSFAGEGVSAYRHKPVRRVSAYRHRPVRGEGVPGQAYTSEGILSTPPKPPILPQEPEPTPPYTPEEILESEPKMPGSLVPPTLGTSGVQLSGHEIADYGRRLRNWIRTLQGRWPAASYLAAWEAIQRNLVWLDTQGRTGRGWAEYIRDKYAPTTPALAIPKPEEPFRPRVTAEAPTEGAVMPAYPGGFKHVIASGEEQAKGYRPLPAVITPTVAPRRRRPRIVPIYPRPRVIGRVPTSGLVRVAEIPFKRLKKSGEAGT